MVALIKIITVYDEYFSKEKGFPHFKRHLHELGGRKLCWW